MRKKLNMDTIVLWLLGYVATLYASFHLITNYFKMESKDLMLPELIKKSGETMRNSPFEIMLNNDSLKIILGISFFYLLIVLYYLTSQKKLMLGKEHGTAEWAGKKDIEKISSKDSYKNVILTKTDAMNLDTRITKKNLNMIVIGGSGSGKTRFFVKPNIMQMNTSYVITDPKGELLKSSGKMLQNAGYDLKVFNIIDFKHSNSYNPFQYIKEDKDILKIINSLIKNTNPKGTTNSDPFWEKAETSLLQALFYYLHHEAPIQEQNFSMLMELLRAAKVSEEDENYKSDLDILFEDLEKENPEHIALKQYQIFKQAAGKTAKSILVSVGVRLSMFNIEELSNLTSYDDMKLDEIGDRKTAIFVVIPDNDDTFNFLVAMMYSQIFESLYYKADFEYGGRLPVQVRFMLDEFANIGQIPDFEKLVATMRSREISVSIIIQNLAQLKTMYKDSWESITGNCDTMLFLGGQEQTSLEYISKRLGKMTIDTKTINYSRGKNSSSTVNYGIHGRELMTPDEIGRLADKNCILLIRGMKPFLSRKYSIEKHPNYKYLDDGNIENTYDYRKVKKGDSSFTIKEADFRDKEVETLEYEIQYEC